jgi:glycosyltransferase involved in cell wall biosynthesis
MPLNPTVVSVFHLNPRKLGSMEEYAVALSRSLLERGWRSVLIFSGPPVPEVESLFEQAGATVEVFRGRDNFRQDMDLLRILLKYRAEVLHFHFFEHYSLLPLWASLARPKLLAFTDHFRQPQPIGPLTRLECFLWDRVFFRLLRVQILAVSEHIKRTLVDCYHLSPRRVQVIHNGVNLLRFVPADPERKAQFRHELDIPLGAPVVVSTSNLRPEKGIGDLLVAAKEILVQKPDALFVIVGEGPMSATLRRTAAELGIQGSVRFVGLRSDVHRFLAAADALAVPAVWQEPAGLVVVEGMAMACPVVATRVGGIPEYLEDGLTGVLVEPGHPEQMAAALLRIFNTSSGVADMGRAARARVERYFSMDRWVSETLRFYDESLGLGGQA